MEQEMVPCIICGKGYPAEDGRQARNGRHFHTCSDACQEKFVAQGGIRRLMEKPVSGRRPNGSSR